MEAECGWTQCYALIMVQYVCTLLELGQLSWGEVMLQYQGKSDHMLSDLKLNPIELLQFIF